MQEYRLISSMPDLLERVTNHLMKYRDYGVRDKRNGYYCTVCENKPELDIDLDDDKLEDQEGRKVQ